MKLEINEIYHNYILKIVIFSLFTYRGLIRQPNVYKQSVLSFTKKRLPWKINLSILTNNENISKEEGRDLILEELLNDKDNKFLKIVYIKFTTPLKETEMSIDLSNEENYQKFLYT